MARGINVQEVAEETLATALGHGHRSDPVLPGTGGPAGNARLTAWTGVVLLVLFLAELVTLLDVRGLMAWHLALGVALIPPALLKTGTTTWRIVSYYLRNRAYVEAGPPPLILRVLGPLVVVSTLALLGTGVALVLLGQARSHQSLVALGALSVNAIWLHQASFVVWAGATGLHVLGRLVPGWMLVSSGARVPSRSLRAVLLVGVLGLAVVCVGWVLTSTNGWLNQPYDDHGPPGVGSGDSD